MIHRCCCFLWLWLRCRSESDYCLAFVMKESLVWMLPGFNSHLAKILGTDLRWPNWAVFHLSWVSSVGFIAAVATLFSGSFALLLSYEWLGLAGTS